MNKPLTLVAKLVAKKGSEALVEKALRGLLVPTRAEAGCRQYDLHRSTEDPAVFLFYETWETKAAWEAHMLTPHLVAMGKATEGHLAERELLQMERIEAR